MIKYLVKALAQETSGNRIIYGNFLDKYTPPSLLELYGCSWRPNL